MAFFTNLREFLGFPKQETCLCMIVSEQEGAEIWINGERTEHLTPKAIAIPRNSEVNIMLRLYAHEDHYATIKSGHHLSFYHCELDRTPLRLVQGGSLHALKF